MLVENIELVFLNRPGSLSLFAELMPSLYTTIDCMQPYDVLCFSLISEKGVVTSWDGLTSGAMIACLRCSVNMAKKRYLYCVSLAVFVPLSHSQNSPCSRRLYIAATILTDVEPNSVFAAKCIKKAS
jgi:hypothetical protein